VEDAVLVLQEREDREQARAAEGGHPQVLRLEGEGQPQPRVGEVASQLAVERAPGLDLGQKLENTGAEDVAPALERGLEAGPEELEAAAVVVEEAPEGRGVLGTEVGHGARHPLHVRGGQQLAAASEHQPVLRIEPHQLDLAVEVLAHGREDLPQDRGVEEEGRAEVEAEALGFQRGGPAAHAGEALEHRYLQSRAGEQDGGSQSSRPGSDDCDAVLHLLLLPSHGAKL
jgi:hypothetical protein